MKCVNTDLGELFDDKPSHPVCGRCREERRHFLMNYESRAELKKPKVRRSLWLVEMELSWWCGEAE
jgi:hypothetical protein